MPARKVIRAIVAEKGEQDHWLYRVEYERESLTQSERFEWLSPEDVPSSLLHRWLRPSPGDVKQEELGALPRFVKQEDEKPTFLPASTGSTSLKREADDPSSPPPHHRPFIRADGEYASADRVVVEQVERIAELGGRLVELETEGTALRKQSSEKQAELEDLSKTSTMATELLIQRTERISELEGEASAQAQLLTKKDEEIARLSVAVESRGQELDVLRVSLSEQARECSAQQGRITTLESKQAVDTRVIGSLVEDINKHKGAAELMTVLSSRRAERVAELEAALAESRSALEIALKAPSVASSSLPTPSSTAPPTTNQSNVLPQPAPPQPARDALRISYAVPNSSTAVHLARLIDVQPGSGKAMRQLNVVAEPRRGGRGAAFASLLSRCPNLEELSFKAAKGELCRQGDAEVVVAGGPGNALPSVDVMWELKHLKRVDLLGDIDINGDRFIEMISHWRQLQQFNGSGLSIYGLEVGWGSVETNLESLALPTDGHGLAVAAILITGASTTLRILHLGTLDRNKPQEVLQAISPVLGRLHTFSTRDAFKEEATSMDRLRGLRLPPTGYLQSTLQNMKSVRKLEFGIYGLPLGDLFTTLLTLPKLRHFKLTCVAGADLAPLQSLTSTSTVDYLGKVQGLKSLKLPEELRAVWGAAEVGNVETVAKAVRVELSYQKPRKKGDGKP